MHDEPKLAQSLVVKQQLSWTRAKLRRLQIENESQRGAVAFFSPTTLECSGACRSIRVSAHAASRRALVVPVKCLCDELRRAYGYRRIACELNDRKGVRSVGLLALQTRALRRTAVGPRAYRVPTISDAAGSYPKGLRGRD